MNKSYRSIWNEALGAWVAVSEIETAKGKPVGSGVECSDKNRPSAVRMAVKIIPLSLCMILGGFILPGSAMAANAMCTESPSPDSGVDNVVVCGPEAVAASNRSIAVGYKAQAATSGSSVSSVAVGPLARSVAAAAAFGVAAEATGSGAVAFGSANLLGNSLPKNQEHTKTVASGQNSIAIGTGATAIATRSTAIGDHAKAEISESGVNVVGGVALGMASVADRAAAVGGFLSSGVVRTDPASIAMPVDPVTGVTATKQTLIGTASTAGAVSIGGYTPQLGNPAGTNYTGNVALYRQITNVAGGTADTDAVNMAQLKEAVTHYYSVNDNGVKQNNYSNDGAVGLNALAAGVNAASSGDAAVAVGSGVNATGGSAVALGDRAEALASQAVAIGQEAKANAAWDISIGRRAGQGTINARSEGRNIAIGDGALRGAEGPNNNTAIGTDASALVKGNFNVAIGTYANAPTALADIKGISEANKAKVEASNTVAIGDRAVAVKGSSVSVGSRTKALGGVSVAIGAIAEASGNYSIAQGYSATASGASSIAIGSAQNLDNKTKATANYAVAVGSIGTEASGESSVALGHDARATSAFALAQGKLSRANAQNNIAVGHNAQAITNTGAIAVGKDALSSGSSSIAVGTGSNAVNSSAVGVGNNSRALGENSIAIGNKAHAQGSGNVVLGANAGKSLEENVEGKKIGNNTVLVGTDAGSEANNNQGQLALGWRAGRNSVGVHNIAAGFEAGQYVNGTSNIAIGEQAGQDGENTLNVSRSVAIGKSAKGKNVDTVAVGSSAIADGASSVAIGKDASVSADNAVAIGNRAAVASRGNGSVAVGFTSKANGLNATAIGQASEAAGQNSFAGGQDSHATGKSSVAVGDGAKAVVDSATAIGVYAHAGPELATLAAELAKDVNAGAGAAAFGSAAKATAYRSLALGASSQATGGSGALAVGNSANASINDAVAIGTSSTSSKAQAVALGRQASANIAGGVAIGYMSKTEADKGVTGTDPLAVITDKNNQIWTSTRAAVAVGDVAGGTTRQITGLAAGTQDTDAVNVAQLKAAGFNLATSASGGEQIDNTAATADKKVQNGETVTVDAGKNIKLIQDGNKITVATKENLEVTSVNAGGNILNGDQMNVGGQTYTNVASAINALDSKIGGSATHYYSVNDGGTHIGNYNNEGASGLNAMAAGVAAQATAVNATAVGHLANASADNATVLGNEATATAKDTVAIGQSADAVADSAVAVGKNAQGAGNFAVSIGLDSQATNDGAVAMGSGAAANNIYTVAIGNDAKALQDGATALGRLAKAESEKSLALGTESQVTSLKGIAIGVNAKALGGTTGTTKTGNIAIGDAAQTESNDSVVIGTNARATVSAENAIVIGKNAAANNGGGNNSVAIGKGAVVTADGSIALGEESKAAAFTTETGVSVPAAGMITAIGYKASGSGMGSVALGSNASTTQNAVYSVAIGNGATAGSTDTSGAVQRGGRYGVAVGNSAKAIADNSAAFGPSAQAQNTGSLALGHSAIASVNSGVALGANSLADVAGGMVGADPLLAASDKNNSTWTSSALYGAVSVGSSVHGITRQITNLAAGTADTDAVNVAQLKAAGFNLATSASDGQLVDSTDVTADKKVQNGETVTVDAGKNIKITQNANTISVATKDEVSFSTVTAQDAQGNKTVLGANGVTITPNGSKTPVSLTSSGLNNGGNVISNVANGSVAKGSTEAVTGDQLYAIQQQLNNSVGSIDQGLNFTGNSGNFNRKMGENTTIKGSLANSVAASSSNIRTVADSTGNIEIMLADAPTFAGKVTAQGLDAGGQKITNVQKGSDNADAVNVEQLQDAIKNVAVATQNVINANSPFSYVNSQGEMLHRSVNPDGSVTFTKSADNTPYTGSDISIAALNAQAPQSTIPTTLGNIKAGTQANDAVNVSQLQNTVTALGGGAAINSDGTIKDPVYNITGTTGGVATVSSVGDALTALNTEVTKALTFSGDNSSEKVKRKLGEELAVKGGATGKLTDNNIGVTGSTADNSLLIKLAEQINLGEAGSLQTGATTVNNNGVTVQASGKQVVSLTSDGLNNGGNTVTNIAAGKNSGDAVNVSQLTPLATALGMAFDEASGTVRAPAFTVTRTDGSTYPAVNTVQGALDHIGTEIRKPLRFTGNSGTTERKLDETLIIKGSLADSAQASDKNIRTKVEGGTLTIELAESPKFGGVTVNDNGKITGVEAGNTAEGSKEAVNGGQLYAQGKGVESIIGGDTVYNPETGSYTAGNIGGTGAGTISDAIAAVKNTANAGWNLTAEGENSSNVAAGETVDLRSTDKNIVITKTADSDQVSFDLADAVTADSLTTGSTVVNNEGVKVGETAALTSDGLRTGDTAVNNEGVKVGETAALTSDGLTLGNAKNGKAPVVLTSDGLNNGGNTVTNIAAGKNSGDAVNVSQLTPLATALGMAFDEASGTVRAPAFTVTRTDGSTYPAVNTVQGALDHIGTEIRKPLRFTGNSGTTERKLDETLIIKGSLADSAQASDKNIRTKVEGGTLTIELAESPKFGGVTVNDNGKITGVEAGNTAEGSKEAVNGGQLYAQGKGVESIIGGDTVYNPETGSYTAGNIGGTGAGTISDAIAAVKNTANAGWNLTAQGKNSSNVQLGETVDLRNNDGNIVVTKTEADDTVAFDLAKTVKVDAVKTGATTVNDNGVAVGDNVTLASDGLKVANPASGKTVSLGSNGLNNGGNVITGLANGAVAQGSQEAVTGDQLFAVQEQAKKNLGEIEKGLNFTGNSGNFNRKMGETVNVKGGLANTDAASADNIRTAADSKGNIEILLADAPTFKGKLSAQGLDAGGQRITGVQKGAEDSDAVNVEQLREAMINASVTTQTVINANAPFSYVNGQGEMLVRSVEADGTVKFHKASDGQEYTGKDISIAALNAQDPQSAVPTVLGNIADGKKPNDAANISQLSNAVKALGGGAAVNPDGSIKAPAYTVNKNDGTVATVGNVGDALNLINAEINKPLTFAGDNKDVKVTRSLDTELAVKGGATGKLTENNIGVTGSTDDNSLSIQLAENINLGEAGSVTAGNTVLNGSGVAVGGNVALTSDGLKAGDVKVTYEGINAGGKKITGVKAGEEATDAVNKAQLDAVQAAASSKVAAQGNLTVKESTNDDGSTTYTLATADDVNFNSVTSGKGDNQVVLDGKGVNVGGQTYITAKGIDANGHKVANVGKGSINAASTDAVNGSQLYGTAASVARIFGGDATVNADGSVQMSNIGGTGAATVEDAIKAVNQAVTVNKVAVVEGDNIVVDKTTNADGSSTYKVSTAKDLKADSVSVGGNTTINGNGISIANGPSLSADGLNAAGKKVTNVADGEISATSKDAVNGSQLYQAYQVLGGNNTSINMKDAPGSTAADGSTVPAGTVTTVVTQPDGTQTTTVETNQKVAVSTDKGGNQYTLTTYNVEGQNTYVTNDVIQAIGKMNEQGIKFFHTNDGEVKAVAQGSNTEDSSASGAYATAIGYQTSASGQGAVALGNTYTATDKDGQAKQQRTQATGKNAVAIGTGSQANNENTIAIGTGNIVNGRNSGAIGDPSVINGNNTYAVGNNNTVNGNNTFVLGNSVTETIDNSVVLGNEAAAKGVHTTAGGGHYTFAGANDANVAGVNDVVGVVSVGKEGQTRQVQNVAAGVVSPTSTDAINGSQLYHTNEAINSVANYSVNMGNQLNQRIGDVESKSNAGTAAAMAVAGLPQAYLPGKSMMAVSGSTYRGESGYAVGFSSISDNGNWVVKGTATGNSRGHYGATAGVGYQW